MTCRRHLTNFCNKVFVVLTQTSCSIFVLKSKQETLNIYVGTHIAGTGRLVWVLAFSTEDDTHTVLYSAVPILAECHYSNIRDSDVCIGMTIRVLAFSTEDDTGIGIFD